jgi:hypothetical protein
MVRLPFSDALAISSMVVFSTPLRAKSCLATSISLSRVLLAISLKKFNTSNSSALFHKDGNCWRSYNFFVKNP